MTRALAGFTHETRNYQGTTRDVWIAGDGPPIIVMHEIPGLHPGVVAFARRLVQAGFRVVMPSLFGSPGRERGPAYVTQSLWRACLSREFTVLATRRNSAITGWLRALSRDEHHTTQRPVGAIGMCLTGGFALAMMVDPHLMAPVLSQPSLPFGVLPHQCRDLGIDDDTLEAVRQRCRNGACVMGLRFSHDRMTPAARFRRLETELGDNFIGIEIDSSPRNEHGIKPWAHSVLASDFVDRPGHPTHDALERVVTFFATRLQLGEAAPRNEPTPG